MFKQHRAGAKVGATSTTSLDQAVDQAEDTFHAFRAKLKSLISTLKAHHEAMIKLNNSQMEATNAICDLLLTTPLARCAIGTTQTKEEEPSEPDEEANEKDTTDSSETQTKASTRDSASSKKKASFVSAGIVHSFDTVIGGEKNLSDVEESFKSLFSIATDVNSVYAARYREWIIGYLEELDCIVSTRIEGRLIQFKKNRQSYAHYTEKVHGLHDKVDRRKSKSDSPRPRLESKLERNLLKLSGAEEAHHDLARSLISLIEDVTGNYWKDMIPLLHMTIKFNINHSSDMAAVLARLERTDANLKDICKQHGIDVTGRLEDLKPEPVPEATQEEVEEPKEEERQDVEEGEEEDEEDVLKNDSEGLASV